MRKALAVAVLSLLILGVLYSPAAEGKKEGRWEEKEGGRKGRTSQRVREMVEEMKLEEKVGQMTQLNIDLFLNFGDPYQIDVQKVSFPFSSLCSGFFFLFFMLWFPFPSLLYALVSFPFSSLCSGFRFLPHPFVLSFLSFLVLIICRYWIFRPRSTPGRIMWAPS